MMATTDESPEFRVNAQDMQHVFSHRVEAMEQFRQYVGSGRWCEVWEGTVGVNAVTRIAEFPGLDTGDARSNTQFERGRLRAIIVLRDKPGGMPCCEWMTLSQNMPLHTEHSDSIAGYKAVLGMLSPKP